MYKSIPTAIIPPQDNAQEFYFFIKKYQMPHYVDGKHRQIIH